MIFPLRTLFTMLLLVSGAAWAQAATTVEVYKSPACGCCEKWIDHLRDNGFSVHANNVSNIPGIRQKLGMPENIGSCHTAKVGNYVIEGHVPAADVKRLLKEKPKAIGLAVPSMPPGSPGMEGSRAVPYDTLLVRADGSTQVFAHH